MPDQGPQSYSAAITVTLWAVLGFIALFSFVAGIISANAAHGDPVEHIRGTVTTGFSFTVFVISVVGIAVLDRGRR